MAKLDRLSIYGGTNIFCTINGLFVDYKLIVDKSAVINCLNFDQPVKSEQLKQE